MPYRSTPRERSRHRSNVRNRRKGYCRTCGNKAKRGSHFCGPCGAHGINPCPEHGREPAEEKLGLDQIHAMEESFRERATAIGLVLVARYHWKHSRCTHWMFDDATGKRVVDFWPSTGRWWCPRTWEKGRLPLDELDQIISIVAERNS